MKVKYIGPITGGVEIAATGTIVGGEEPTTVEVTDELGVALCEQTTNWEPADPASKKTLGAFCDWIAAHEKVFSNETLQWSWRPKAPATTTTTAAPAADTPEG